MKYSLIIIYYFFVLTRVSEAFVNQKRIDAKIKQLNQNTNNFLNQTQQWVTLLENFNTALKV